MATVFLSGVEVAILHLYCDASTQGPSGSQLPVPYRPYHQHDNEWITQLEREVANGWDSEGCVAPFAALACHVLWLRNGSATNLLFFSAPDGSESSMERFAVEESSCGLHSDAKENHAPGVQRA